MKPKKKAIKKKVVKNKISIVEDYATRRNRNVKKWLRHMSTEELMSELVNRTEREKEKLYEQIQALEAITEPFAKASLELLNYNEQFEPIM